MSEHEMSMQELIDWMPGYEWIMPSDSDSEVAKSEPVTERVQIKAITLWQPWASLIAVGLKRYETRSWETSYRGKLLIHAAKRPVDDTGLEIWRNAYALSNKKVETEDLPLGKVVAIADLTNCLEMVIDLSRSPTNFCNIHLQTKTELWCGDWRVGRFAWKLENVKALSPIPAKGKQQLWVPDREVITQVEAQVNSAN